MFHEMRRKKQQLLKKDAEEILYRGSFGVLALSGDDGYPYAVPISYLYDEGKLYFHCAKSGHKLDAVLKAKNIPAFVDYWGYDVNHDWDWWRRQAAYFLGKIM